MQDREADPDIATARRKTRLWLIRATLPAAIDRRNPLMIDTDDFLDRRHEKLGRHKAKRARQPDAGTRFALCPPYGFLPHS
jgi:hypothetical protein